MQSFCLPKMTDTLITQEVITSTGHRPTVYAICPSHKHRCLKIFLLFVSLLWGFRTVRQLKELTWNEIISYSHWHQPMLILTHLLCHTIRITIYSQVIFLIILAKAVVRHGSLLTPRIALVEVQRWQLWLLSDSCDCLRQTAVAVDRNGLT